MAFGSQGVRDTPIWILYGSVTITCDEDINRFDA
jgi:hypothetical protein